MTTLTRFHTTLLHHGMVIVGLPYSCQDLIALGEISGGTPCGASTLAGGGDSRRPGGTEPAIAPFQGRHLAETAAKPAA